MEKEDYEKLMIITNALHQNNDPKNPNPKSSGVKKWMKLLRYFWLAKKSGYEGRFF